MNMATNTETPVERVRAALDQASAEMACLADRIPKEEVLTLLTKNAQMALTRVYDLLDVIEAETK